MLGLQTDTVTAYATLALAAVTAWLAWTTRRLAREAGDETRANWRPVLVIEAYGSQSGITPAVQLADGVLALCVQNVGRGPALLVDGSLTDPTNGTVIAAGRGGGVIAPGAVAVVTWREFDPPWTTPRADPRWTYEGGELTYSDVSYAGYRTRFTVAYRRESSEEVEEVVITDQFHEAVDAGRLAGRLRRLRTSWTVRREIRRSRRTSQQIRQGDE